MVRLVSPDDMVGANEVLVSHHIKGKPHFAELPLPDVAVDCFGFNNQAIKIKNDDLIDMICLFVGQNAYLRTEPVPQ